MVSKITDIDYFIVDTELEALLLENSLIKKHQPKYNIQLRDDKTFPWICIKNERFPRIVTTRRPIKDGSQYYGPYASVKMMNLVLSFINELYPLRNCNLNLSKNNIQNKKFKVCLEYHIGNCLGPCENLQNESDYSLQIEQIREIIKGDIGSVKNNLRSLMNAHSLRQEYEKAQVIKEKLELLKKYQAKSTVVNQRIDNVDVYSIAENEKSAFVNYMKVSRGAIVQTHTVEMRKKLDESSNEILAFAITSIRKRFESTAKENIVSIDPGLSNAFNHSQVSFITPIRGDKKKLLQLATRNAKHYMIASEKHITKSNSSDNPLHFLKEMETDLRLKEPPVHIECFDNSNLQGTNPVSAMVVFKNGRPSRKDYRHYNIKTVIGPDDYESMREVIYRRYLNVLNEGQKLPQLIILDGGKGQLSAAMDSLKKLGLDSKVGVIGVAKKLEEIYYPNDPIPLYLDKRSLTLKTIQHLRNEAHRFGITHHRKLRIKKTIHSELLEISGIGQTTANSLLRKFGSVKKIKLTNINIIAEVIGPAKAKLIEEHFKRSR
jgi:excinuclease ABC subunit C